MPSNKSTVDMAIKIAKLETKIDALEENIQSYMLEIRAVRDSINIISKNYVQVFSYLKAIITIAMIVAATMGIKNIEKLSFLL